MKSRIVSTALSLVKSLDSLRRIRAVRDSAGARRYLFLNYSPALGTSLQATPVLEALKLAQPNCQIAVAAAGIPFEVLLRNPYVDHLWQTPTPEAQLGAATLALRRRLRTSGYEPHWVCTDSWNQRTKTVLLGVFAGNFQRVGFAVNRELLDRAITYDPRLSIIDNNLQLLPALGMAASHLEPRIFFSPEDLDHCNGLLHEPPGGRPRAALIVQGSGNAPTMWYVDRFAQIGDYLHNEHGFEIVFVGAARDASHIDEIRHLMKAPSTSLAGKTNIGVLSAVLASCDVGIGIDTGTMHVARAVRLPFVLISSAREPVHTWLPIDQPQIAIVRKDDIECRDCHKRFCATRECMDYIQPAEVKSALQVILTKYPPSLDARTSRVQRSLH
jgi:ADP-heptose:LPS heptosyltransferase